MKRFILIVVLVLLFGCDQPINDKEELFNDSDLALDLIASLPDITLDTSILDREIASQSKFTLITANNVLLTKSDLADSQTTSQIKGVIRSYTGPILDIMALSLNILRIDIQDSNGALNTLFTETHESNKIFKLPAGYVPSKQTYEKLDSGEILDICIEAWTRDKSFGQFIIDNDTIFFQILGIQVGGEGTTSVHNFKITSIEDGKAILEMLAYQEFGGQESYTYGVFTITESNNIKIAQGSFVNNIHDNESHEETLNVKITETETSLTSDFDLEGTRKELKCYFDSISSVYTDYSQNFALIYANEHNIIVDSATDAVLISTLDQKLDELTFSERKGMDSLRESFNSFKSELEVLFSK